MPQVEKDLKVPWAVPITTRDGTLSKDSKMVNAFVEIEPEGKTIVKRPGTSYVTTKTGTPQGQVAISIITSSTIEGYFIVNDTLFSYDGSLGGGAGLAIPTVPAAGLPYSTLAYVPPGTTGTGNALLQSCTGSPNFSGLWVFDPTVPSITKVSSANYPRLTVPGIVLLDGVFYAMDINGKIVGSALNDPTTWPALDFVVGDGQLGGGAGIHRHLNYIVAFYTKGMQLFYDANAAPNGQGIAIAPVSNASWRTGLVAADTIVEMSDMMFFMGQDELYGRTIQMMSGLTLSKVSTPYVEKVLNTVPRTANGIRGLVNAWAFGVRTTGHQFYVITFPDINITLAYDLTSQNWSQWTSVVSGVEQYFVGRYYLNADTGDTVQDVTTGKSMLFSPTVYTDATGNLPVTCITDNHEWGTKNWKRFAAMFQFGDTVSTTVGVSFSDNDYQTFSTPRTVDLSTSRKMLRNCGRSRRRAWKLTHTDNTPLRLNDMSVLVAGLDG